MQISFRDRLVGLLAPFPGVRARLARLREASVDEAALEQAFCADLRLLHDLLTQAGAIDAIWVWSGLLLGWAREGGPLRHDLRDADFCIRRDDIELIEHALPLLESRGFVEESRYIGNEGQLQEIKVRRNWALFEFFLVDERDGFFETRSYGIDHRPTEFVTRVPAQPLVPFELLDRTWLKVDDHDRELCVLYGNWRVPDPGFSFMRQSPSIVERRPWARRKEFVESHRARQGTR
jgi:hypothetical protein